MSHFIPTQSQLSERVIDVVGQVNSFTVRSAASAAVQLNKEFGLLIKADDLVKWTNTKSVISFIESKVTFSIKSRPYIPPEEMKIIPYNEKTRSPNYLSDRSEDDYLSRSPGNYR